MGKAQSKIQVASLVMLFLSACIIEKILPLEKLILGKKKETDIDETLPESDDMKQETAESDVHASRQQHTTGVIAVLTASFISGLAGSLTQKSLQHGVAGSSGVGRNSYLFSMELCVASTMIFFGSLIRSDDGKRIR